MARPAAGDDDGNGNGNGDGNAHKRQICFDGHDRSH
jgi:hypothetical protein